jgi:hypothetical protein
MSLESDGGMILTGENRRTLLGHLTDKPLLHTASKYLSVLGKIDISFREIPVKTCVELDLYFEEMLPYS